MEYRIHHLSPVAPIGQPSSLEEDIRNNLSPLQHIFHNYPGKPVLHFFIKNETEKAYRIFASLHLNGNDILVKEEGTDTLAVVKTMFDKLLSQVKKQLLFERKDYLEKRKNRISKMADSFLPQMEDHIEQNDEAAFINLAKEVLPEASNYIERWLLRRLLPEHPETNALFSVQNLAREIYKELYTSMQRESYSADHILPRILSIAENTLAKLEKEHPEISIQGSDTKQFNKTLPIFMSINAKPLLEEDLDEKYFAPGEYSLAEILYDAGLTDNAIDDASYKKNNRNIRELIEAMPLEQKAVFEMHYLDRFSNTEIAYIMHASENDIERIIEEGRMHLVNALNRHQTMAI